MGKIPPVKINWEQGFNSALRHTLMHTRDEFPNCEIHFKSIIDHVRMYGRVKTKDDGSGQYDSLYLYENEAADIIYSLMHYIMQMRTTFDNLRKHYEKIMDRDSETIKLFQETIVIYERMVETYKTMLGDLESMFDELFFDECLVAESDEIKSDEETTE